MYAEFLTDPVITMLSFDDQRHFVAVLCMKASGVLDKEYVSEDLRLSVISSLMGLSSESAVTGSKSALDEVHRRLKCRGLVDDTWQPVNWDKRQFQSDSGAERMRRW